jgi:hypothetical protein
LVEPLVTIAVPSLNQGAYLDAALSSIFAQDLPVEVHVLDGGSTDNSLDVISTWEDKLASWRSGPDAGQSAAINEGIALGSAPYVCWLNSDDFYYTNGLKALLSCLENSTQPAAYGNCWNVTPAGHKALPYLTLPFYEFLLANYCFVAQPSTLIRRTAWETVGGLDESLQLAMDYDLWWKLYLQFGKFKFCSKFVAANRMHSQTKTRNGVDLHYRESIDIIEKSYGRIPLKWKLLLPVMRKIRALARRFDF